MPKFMTGHLGSLNTLIYIIHIILYSAPLFDFHLPFCWKRELRSCGAAVCQDSGGGGSGGDGGGWSGAGRRLYGGGPASAGGAGNSEALFVDSLDMSMYILLGSAY